MTKAPRACYLLGILRPARRIDVRLLSLKHHSVCENEQKSGIEYSAQWKAENSERDDYILQ